MQANYKLDNQTHIILYLILYHSQGVGKQQYTEFVSQCTEPEVEQWLCENINYLVLSWDMWLGGIYLKLFPEQRCRVLNALFSCVVELDYSRVQWHFDYQIGHEWRSAPWVQSELRRNRIQVSSSVVSDRMQYSASALDLATKDYFLDHQEIKLWHRKIQAQK